MWTVTLVSNGIKEQVQANELGTCAIRTIEDAEGRVIQFRYEYVAVDEENGLATAFYSSRKTITRKRYKKRAARIWPAEVARA